MTPDWVQSQADGGLLILLDGWMVGEAGVVGAGRWGQVGAEGARQVACKLTRTLFPRSLIQALLTVVSQVLRFLAVEWYLPLLVSSLVLGWLNLLYYTRGLQHTGIYSVMIQKVRDGAR